MHKKTSYNLLKAQLKMKKTLVILIVALFFIQESYAQNVGINSTGNIPDPSAMLDIVSSDKGLLIPRVALTGTSDATTITNGNVTSLLVYNTATAGVAPNDVTPGYYYWDGVGNEWVRFFTGSQSNDWTLLGNAGTNPTTNFIGTTDAQDFVVRTNNTEKIRVESGGNVGIGTNSPTAKFEVYKDADSKLCFGEHSSYTSASSIWTSGASQYTMAISSGGSVYNNARGDWSSFQFSINGGDPILTINRHPSLNFDCGQVQVHDNFYTLPDQSAKFQVNSTKGGFKMPTMTMTQRNLIDISNLAEGCLIYQTDNTPGFYYCDDNNGSGNWVMLGGGGSANAWDLLGNSGTTAGTNFIGTLDAVDWVVKTNGLERMRVESDGNIGIGTTSPMVRTQINEAVGQSLLLIRDDSGVYGNDQLGGIGFDSRDGNVPDDIKECSASIIAFASETQGIYDKGGHLTFWTSPTDQNDDTDGFERMRIDQAGNVGIGTTTPTQKFVVNGRGMFGTNTMVVGTAEPIVTGGASAGISYQSRDATARFVVYNNASLLRFWSGADRMTISTTGNLQISGSVATKQLTSTWTIASDERLKDIHGSYTKGLNEILQLNPISYNYKNVGERTFDETVLNTKAVGFSAQEVQEIFPEAVGVADDGYLNLNIHPILVAYVNAIKELNLKVVNLEEQNQENIELKNRVEQLEKDIEELKQLLTE